MILSWLITGDTLRSYIPLIRYGGSPLNITSASYLYGAMHTSSFGKHEVF